MESKKSTPDSCDNCNKPFEKKKNKRITIRREIDPVSNKLLRLCNSCGLRIFRARWRVKKERAKVVTQDEKDNYKLEVEEFSKLVNEIVNDEEISRRLGCPVATPKICRCIQRYLTMDNKFSGDLRTCTLSLARTKELQELCKSAKDLIQTREVGSSDSMEEKKSVSSRPKLRSKDYEEYVFANRNRLKEECSLCERGCQRVLCYSNNFLHKQLKSNSKNEARVVGKHSNLLPLSQLSDYKCCKQRCTGMAAGKSDWHQLVFTWRKRALACQREARQVLAEMCRPAGNRTTNCRQFIKQVTGCSDGLLAKVRKELKQSLGFREPPEHGLKEYWRQKKIKAASKRGPAKEVNTRVATKLNEVVKESRIEVLKGGTKVMAGSTRLVTTNTRIIAGNTKAIGGNDGLVRTNSTLPHLKNLEATPDIANSLRGASTSKNLQPCDKINKSETASRITTSTSKYSTDRVFTRANEASSRQTPTPVVSENLKTADTDPKTDQTADSNQISRRITDIVSHGGEETSVDSNEKSLEITDCSLETADCSLETADCSRGSVSGNQLILSAYEDADSLQVSEEAEQIEIIKIIEGNSCDQFSDTDCSRLVYMTPAGMSVFEFPK
ncbi:uncharacterized protein LOC111049610 isoform X2 [Nilaparvata lugens]|uniref:uncharacterized protein LOC111049610 isoform X2 n=1 Tax=Nilaparvata lugens TaxID=108931 RepID=UPI00193DCB9E|nr:uncharacterized protein LOC111049610 isoform X2 [Nilaparvata lugens]